MEKKYWFILKQSVFVWRKESDCYFYDSESFKGKYFALKDIATENFVEKIKNIENLYSLLLTARDLEEEGTKDIVVSLIEMNMAKLIDQTCVEGKPIQLPPILNLQSDVSRLKHGELTDLTIGTNVLINLHSIWLKLDNNLSCIFVDKVIYLLKNLERISLLEVIISGYTKTLNIEPSFWDQLKRLACTKRFILELNFETNAVIELIKSFFISNVMFDIEIHPDSSLCVLEKIVNNKENDEYLKYNFHIFSEADFIWANQLIKTYQIKKYQISPRYNRENIDFFERYVYVNEQDILDSHQNKQNIFAHQALNTNDFGRLTITTDNKVYANINQPVIGTIDEDIRILVYKEMNEGNSWLRIRNMRPCSNCVFQWLCPSPSDYELEIGKPNLCHIM